METDTSLIMDILMFFGNPMLTIAILISPIVVHDFFHYRNKMDKIIDYFRYKLILSRITFFVFFIVGIFIEIFK
jgi:hypothetical protein